MIRLSKFFVVAIVSTLISYSALAQGAGDSHADRVAAAQKLLKVQSMETLMMEMADGISQSMPPEHRKMFIEMIGKEYDIPMLESAAMNAMVKIFTAKEINALAVFYGSSEGQSIQRKMSPYMAELMPVVQKAALEAVQRYMQKLQNQQRAPQPR
jgi:hypothetical protein